MIAWAARFCSSLGIPVEAVRVGRRPAQAQSVSTPAAIALDILTHCSSSAPM